jgi:ATP-dependent DNA helicase RecG
LEFKEAKTQFDNRRLYEYCVAIANEGGGHLLLGVADKPPRPVIGTQAFNDPVGMEEKLFQAVGFRVDIEQVAHPDGRVLVFHIPSRPRGTAYHLNGKYLMRAGEALVPMSEDQLRRIFAEGEPDWLEEPSRSNLDAQEVVEVLDTQTFFELLKLPYPTDRQGVIDRLRHERLVDLESAHETFGIRRLGVLLLAKRLDEFPDLTRKAPRVVVYTGTSKLDTRMDRTGTKGYAVGFQGLVRFVMSQLPQNEIIEDALRKEVKLVPEVVIRELLANALIHQDFSIGGSSVMVEIYSNRVEISNPGEPIVPVERFIDGYQSRNERLADLMRRMGICEEKEQWNRQGGSSGRVSSVARTGFQSWASAHGRHDIWPQGFRCYGSGGSNTCVLSALRSEMGYVGANDKPVAARAIPASRGQECDRFADHRGDYRGRADQAG